jgi:flagellar biosynthesis protein FlhG
MSQKQSLAPRIIAVGGGKGGVGKTMLVSSIATSLAMRGYNTLAVDLDLGGANLHTWLAEPLVQPTLAEFINHDAESLEGLAHKTSIPNLHLIHGARDHLTAANLRHAQKQRLFSHLKRMPYDWIVLDLGAGTTFNSLDFFLLSDRGIVVAAPEPTSIENLYGFIKAVYFRALHNVIPEKGFRELILDFQSGRGHSQRPDDFLRSVDQSFPHLVEQVRSVIARLRLYLVTNQVLDDEDTALGEKMSFALERYMGLMIPWLGAIHNDDMIVRAVRRRKNLMRDLRDTTGAEDVWRITDRLISPQAHLPTQRPLNLQAAVV